MDKRLLVLEKVEPDALILVCFFAVIAEWHTTSSSWNSEDFLEALLREVFCSKSVPSMENVTFKTKSREPGAEIAQCFGELELL